MLQASGTRKISQPRSKDSKARQAGPVQSDLQRNVLDLCAVDGGARWRSYAKCPQAPGFQTWPPCLESCSFGALRRRRWPPTNPGSIAAATAIRRASGFAMKPSAKLLVKSRRATRRELSQDQTNHSKIPQVTFGSFGRRRRLCAWESLPQFSPMARRLRIVRPRDHAPQGKIAS